jgi:transposase InsO family protein
MRFHSNAATNRQQRRFLRHAPQTCRSLAAQFQVSVATIHTWKHREEDTDRSCRPHTIHHALDEQEEQLVLWMRQTGQMALDDLLDALEPVLPQVRRSSLHRLLVRHGCSRLPPKQQQPSGETGAFKEYGPGFLHIDCFYLPQLAGRKYYCFVAIDRATRLVLLHVYQNKDKEAATDFLRRCLEFYPFRIQKILTDNGLEFTQAGFKNRGGTIKKVHPFPQLCQDNAIEHRQTRPYTPKTNGMVERTNGLIKQGTTKQHTYKNVEQMKDDLHSWFVVYNFKRKHRRIGRITPYEAVCQWHQRKPELFKAEPTDLLDYRSQSRGT